MTVEFFPINTPLVNYFFYKAPFISDSYSLSSASIGNGGTSFNVNDIVILAPSNPSEYTNPVVIKVTSLNPSSLLQKVISIIINGSFAGGSHYSVDDIISLNLIGSGSNIIFSYINAQIKVTSIGPNGAISGITILNEGMYDNAEVFFIVQNTTSGIGFGLNIAPPAFTTQTFSLNLGIIKTFEIINNGNFLSPTPSIISQIGTNGSGIGASLTDLNFVPSNQIPPGPNIPLAGGFLFFYADEDHTLQLPTYSDISDPNNPVVNTNPIQLGAAGDCPLFYLENRLYYIVITDYTGDQANPQHTISHYNPSESAQSGGNILFNENAIVNPQFSFPITFWETSQKEGEISQPVTRVAWGWDFQENEGTSSENFVTFENIVGQSIEGTPIFQILLTCSVVSSSETTKDFVQTFGEVDYLSGTNLTFSAQMINEISGTINVNLILELNYGQEGSPTRLINLTTFTVNQTRKKFTFSFIMPSIAGFTIGDNNYAAIHIQPALGQTCTFGMTNVLLLPGNIANPIFSDEPDSYAKSQIIGDSVDIDNAGLDQNYSSYYYAQGTIFPYADTGTIVLAKTGSPQPFRHICDGSALRLSGYTNNIPNQRLYNVIGNTFGSSGTLVVTSNANVVTVSSAVGAREHSAYTAGTTSFTVTNTIIGLQMGINLLNNFDNTVTGTFIDKFAPDQSIPPYQNNPFQTGTASIANYWGSIPAGISPNTILTNTVLPGSGVQNAVFTMNFTSNFPADYRTRFPNTSLIASWMEFSSFANNTRRPTGQNSNNQQILFQLDNLPVPAPGESASIGPPYSISASKLVIVPFFSTQSIAQCISTFCAVIANPFQWTIVVNTVPTAGQDFLFSDTATDFYGWFKVNGVGTDPAIGGRTGVEINISSTDTTTQVATIIAQTLNSFEYTLPSPADLPALAAGTKVSWYINL